MQKHSFSNNDQKISDILHSFSQKFATDQVSIRQMRDTLSERVYGMLLLVLALPNLVPFPVPGLSVVTGFPLFLLSMQWVFNFRRPWFPAAVLKRTIKTEYLRKICVSVSPYLHKLERFIKPRLSWLVRYFSERVIAIICVLLSLVLMLPIPLGNALPALALCFFAIAILERDGVFVILGLLFTLVTVSVIGGIVGALVMTTLHFLGL